MPQSLETKFDYDHTAGTEDRFAMRHYITDLKQTINESGRDQIANLFSPSATAEGLSEFTFQKDELVDFFYKKFFGRRHNYISLPELKLTYSDLQFKLHGSYEEYQEGILSAAGSITIMLIKVDDRFSIIKIKFYPRMRTVS